MSLVTSAATKEYVLNELVGRVSPLRAAYSSADGAHGVTRPTLP